VTRIKDFLLGMTAENIKEITMTIRSKVTVSLLGQMEDNMTDNGIMESKTEWEYTTIQDLKFVLIDRPNLRELYDKTETFIRKKQEKSIHNPS
jgi:hypothetical protein